MSDMSRSGNIEVRHIQVRHIEVRQVEIGQLETMQFRKPLNIVVGWQWEVVFIAHCLALFSPTMGREASHASISDRRKPTACWPSLLGAWELAFRYQAVDGGWRNASDSRELRPADDAVLGLHEEPFS